MNKYATLTPKIRDTNSTYLKQWILEQMNQSTKRQDPKIPSINSINELVDLISRMYQMVKGDIIDLKYYRSP